VFHDGAEMMKRGEKRGMRAVGWSAYRAVSVIRRCTDGSPVDCDNPRSSIRNQLKLDYGYDEERDLRYLGG
jgi:hypothetical protein